MRRDPGRVIGLLTGLLVFFLLQLLFVSGWDRLFNAAPWPGYEESARLGLIEPWFVNSPRSLWLTRATFFLVALLFAAGRARDRWTRAFMLWTGAALALVVTYATTRMPAMPGGRLGYVVYPFRIALPILLGTALGALARRTVLPSRSRAESRGSAR